jgi:large subunit ribosomal protein L28
VCFTFVNDGGTGGNPVK